MGPVRPRVPVRSLLVVALVACAYPAWTLVVSPLRADLATVPVAWLAGVAALWFAGFIVPLSLALVPIPGQVVPDGARAFRAALLLAVVLLGISLIGVESARHSPPPGSPASWHECLIRSLKLSAPTIVAGALVLRRVALVDSWRLGAALGVAGGALAGLTLQLACASASPAHVGLAHGGGLVLAAVIGALVVPALVRLKR